MAQITQNNNSWNISGDVVIRTVPLLLDASKALSISANTTIDFAGVTDIDTATISLILEWKRRAKKENHSINFAHFPDNLNSLTQLYGVAELIN